MSALIQLLAAGRSLATPEPAEHRFRMAGRKWTLPFLDGGRDRGAEVPATVAPLLQREGAARGGEATAPARGPAISAIVGEAGAPRPALPPRPVRADVFRRLMAHALVTPRDMRPEGVRALFSFRPAASRPVGVPRLSLETLRVVRNDLSDADLEVVRRPLAASVAGTSSGLEAARVSSRRSHWGRFAFWLPFAGRERV